MSSLIQILIVVDTTLIYSATLVVDLLGSSSTFFWRLAMKMGELRESFPLFSVYCILLGIVRLLQLGLDGFHSVLDHTLCIMMLDFVNPAQIIITVITLFHRLDKLKSSEPFADTTSCSLLLKDHKESLTSLLTALKCQLQAKNQSVKFSARTLYIFDNTK